MLVKLWLVCLACVLVTSDRGEYSRDKRKARLFSFNTLDNDIVVNLEFSIPFLTVPVKKTMESGLGLGNGLSSLGLPSINLNPSALALGGAIVLGSTVLIPLLLKNFAKHHPQQRYSKLLNNAEFEADMVLEFVHEVLQNRNFYGCALRVACWSGESAHYIEFMKMWDQVMSNKIISNMVNTTAVEEAMIQGRKGLDCLTYAPCPLQKNHLPGIMKNIALLTKTYDLF